MTALGRLGPYVIHPLADALPLTEGEAFDELVADIKTNGLHEPIIISHDKTTLIDGRNRYRACEAAGVDLVYHQLPAFYTATQILDLIASRNVKGHRNLSTGQVAFFGLAYEEQFAAATKKGPNRENRLVSVEKTAVSPSSPSTSIAGSAGAKAAAVVGGSERQIRTAKAIRRDAPDLEEKVVRNELTLEAAQRERKKRVAQQPKPEPPASPTPKLLTLRTHTGAVVEYPEPKAKATFNTTPGDGISWAQWSWNPVTGCLHGCDYCYARELATSTRLANAFPAGFTPLFHHERLDAPANTVIPSLYRHDPAWRRVFVCSMADLYGRWVPDEWIARVHAAMIASPQWEYLLLTKFPARYVGLDLPSSAWVGTSVDEQKRVRIAEDAFRQIGGVKVKWLSLEPLREPLEFTDLSMFDWVVIGAQTQTRQPGGVVPAFAPPFEWVARLVSQARAAGCRVHLKPNLMGRVDADAPGMTLPDEYPVVGEGCRPVVEE